MAGVAAVIALGSNLGDREHTLRSAIRAMATESGLTVVGVSSLYESSAVRVEGVDASAPSYLNAVASVTTTLSARDLLSRLQRIEDAHGRVRRERWGDRTLDLDIITYGYLMSDDEALTIPHPRSHCRSFVLAPWLELEPHAEVPGVDSVAALLDAAEDLPQRYAPWAP